MQHEPQLWVPNVAKIAIKETAKLLIITSLNEVKQSSTKIPKTKQIRVQFNNHHHFPKGLYLFLEPQPVEEPVAPNIYDSESQFK